MQTKGNLLRRVDVRGEGEGGTGGWHTMCVQKYSSLRFVLYSNSNCQQISVFGCGALIKITETSKALVSTPPCEQEQIPRQPPLLHLAKPITSVGSASHNLQEIKYIFTVKNHSRFQSAEEEMKSKAMLGEEAKSPKDPIFSRFPTFF